MSGAAADSDSSSPRRPSLLVLNLFMVHPPDTGAKIVIWNRIVELSREFEITFCCLDEGPVSDASLAELGRHCRVVRVRPQAHGSMTGGLLDAVREPSVRVFAAAVRAWYCGPEFGALRDADFDLIEIHSSCWHRRELESLHGLRVLVVHNDEAEYWRGQADAQKAETSLRSRLGARFDAVQAGRQQRRALRSADAIVALSARDADRLRHLAAARPWLSNLGGVDCTAYAGVAAAPAADPPELVFVAALFVDAAAEAASRFAREVLPRLREGRSVRLRLVGDHRGNPTIASLGELPGVEITGYVDDVRPSLAAASIVVVPLIHGSGIRYKIMEACAAGRAVVATRKGAEGLGLIDGKHARLTDTIHEMADPIADLLDNAEARSMLATQARELALRCFCRRQHHADLAVWYQQLRASAEA